MAKKFDLSIKNPENADLKMKLISIADDLTVKIRLDSGEELSGKGKIDTFFGQPGRLLRSPFAFKQHGQCGQWVSDLFPNLAECVDDLTFLQAMTAKSSGSSSIRRRFALSIASRLSLRRSSATSLPSRIVPSGSLGKRSASLISMALDDCARLVATCRVVPADTWDSSLCMT